MSTVVETINLINEEEEKLLEVVCKVIYMLLFIVSCCLTWVMAASVLP